MRIRQVNLWQTGKQTVQEVAADDVSGLSAELAYRFFLALFPFFIFLAALGGIVAGLLNVANPAERLVGLISDQLPDDAANVLETQLRGVVETQNPGLLSIGILGAIWAASSGFKAVMKALNRAYDVEETRPFWKKNLVGLGLTLLAGGFVVGAFALVVVGQFLIGQVAEALGLGSVWQSVIAYGRWPVAVALIVAATAFLYWAAPNIGLPFKWITPGAILFTVVWFLATALFGLYIANFGSYNATYGTMGGVVVLLVWFYITAFILLVGGEINAIVDEQVDPQEVQAKREAKRAEAERHRRGRPGARTRQVPTPAPPVPASAQRAAQASPTATLLGAAVAGLTAWRLLQSEEQTEQ